MSLNKLKFNNFLPSIIKMKTVVFLLLIVFIATFDLLSKKYVYLYLNKMDGYLRINEFLNFVIVYNHGIVFGIFNESRFFSKTIILFNAVILFYLFTYLINDSRTNLYKIGISFIIGGGLGNLIEKIISGHVFDFIDFHISSYHWYVFNVADTFVCLGIFVLFLSEVIEKRKK